MSDKNSRIVYAPLPPGYGAKQATEETVVEAQAQTTSSPMASVPVVPLAQTTVAQPTMAAVPILGANPIVAAVATSSVKLEDPRVKSAVRTDVNNRRFLFEFGSTTTSDVATLMSLEIKSTEDVSRGSQILRRLYAKLPFKSYPRRGGTVSKKPKELWLEAVKAMDEAFTVKMERFLNEEGGLQKFLTKRQFN